MNAETLAAPPPRSGPFAAFGNRSYLLFWVGAIITNTGSWVSAIAIPFVIFDFTGSGVWLGIVAVATFVPGVILAPYGGVLADRYPRRKVLLMTQAAGAVAALGLLAMWLAGVRDPTLLLVPVALGGAVNGLNLPAWQSFVNDLVSRSELDSAVTLQALQLNVARAVGPLVAGILIAGGGPENAFAVNAVSFVLTLLILLVVRPQRVQEFPTPRRSAIAELASAARYTLERPRILLILGISMSIGIFVNPIFSLTVVLADINLEAGADVVGGLNAALGIGAVLMAPFVARLGRRRGYRGAITGGLVVLAFGVGIVGLASTLISSLAALLLIGAAFVVVIVGTNSTLHHSISDEVRGRIVALRHVAYTSGFPIGSLLTGVLIDTVGIRWALVGCGTGLAITAVACATLGRHLTLTRSQS
ncbi:MFS transporter [Microterricola pindariensis]|uniref:Major facilitator superfamily (MFS) profile domain-containing protein n=1 Tax=Microterricola pindariensis TaxID=478010 RepID=A0ABX5AU11_9MICO|nr:MFS transporter [Microterricola pindariensis]PPL17192.1 hypothetical protein GY24_11705 [Microterricola pindariensis]